MLTFAVRSVSVPLALLFVACAGAATTALPPKPVPSAAPPQAAAEPEAAPSANEPVPAATIRAVVGDAQRFSIPVSPAQPALGSVHAGVTIVEWGDYQCPFTARLEPTLDQLMTKYAGQIRRVWRNNPLPYHKERAEAAAQLAMEAFAQGGDEAFWRVHRLLFENQTKLASTELAQLHIALANLAATAAMEPVRTQVALAKDAHLALLSSDAALAQSFGAHGTPSVFINGRLITGAQPIERFVEIIDDELARADALRRLGVPEAHHYNLFVRDGLTKPADPAAVPSGTERVPDPNAVYEVPVGTGAQIGPANALVTVIEYAEFECPFSKRVQPTLKALQAKYGKDVRIVFRHNPLPFHKQSRLAAEAALAARDQGKFWEYHDLLFEKQPALKQSDLEAYAEQLKLNMVRFKSALNSGSHVPEIEADQALALKLGATGTPSFYINGRQLRGAQPITKFEALIDEELAKAEAKVKAGTPRTKLYAATIKGGAVEPKFVEQPAKPPESYFLRAPARAPFRGPERGAKVVIEEFADFECPFSARVQATLEQVRVAYGNRVQIVWRNYPLPFHTNAMSAHEAAMEVFEQRGSAAFFQYHDALFAHQDQLTQGDLVRYAETISGVDAQKVAAAIETQRHRDRVLADMEAVTKAGARIGTPSFFINGTLMQGAQPYAAFAALIDAALAQ